MAQGPSTPAHIEEKGWGYEIWIHNSPQYCGKLLTIIKGRKTSLHYHAKKRETFYVNSGSIWVRVINTGGIESEFDMSQGDVFEVPPGLVHQFGGLSDKSEILEVATQHLQSDIFRIEEGDVL